MINAIVYGNPQEMYNAIRGKYGTHELEIANKNTKGVKVRLIDAISQEQTFNLPIVNDKGKRVYRPVKFSPNTLYKVPDDNFLEILQIRGLTKKKYSVELEEALKKAETPYKIVTCKSCGGGVRKIEVQIFEVIGE